MAVRGIFASHSGIVGDRRGDLAARVLMTMPGGTAPLLAISSGMESERTTDTAFSWIEDAHISGNTAVNGTVAAGATSVVVDDANIITPNSILMNEDSGEHIFVSAISGNTLTIVRGIGGTTPAELTDDDTLQLIGTAFEEGGGKPIPVATRGESITNYVQIFKQGWAITGTAQAVGFHTGSQMALNREQCLAFHAEGIERSMLWGKKHIATLNNKQFRMTSGILQQIELYGGLVESANSGAAGTLKMKDLIDFLRRIFDYRVKGFPNERIGFTGSKVIQIINEMVLRDSTYNIQQGITSYGIQVTKIVGINGDLSLMTHPLMTENPIWATEIYILHPGLIKKRVLRETWTEEFSPGRQNNNGTDATEGYIADEMGFQLKGAKTMGILRNITTSAASF